jgi:hypothetical protein
MTALDSCPACTHPRVTLIDGSETCTWSEAWRAETEARHILAMPDKLARREYLRGREEAGKIVKRGVFQVRGEAACLALEAQVRKVWEARR